MPWPTRRAAASAIKAANGPILLTRIAAHLAIVFRHKSREDAAIRKVISKISTLVGPSYSRKPRKPWAIQKLGSNTHSY